MRSGRSHWGTTRKTTRKTESDWAEEKRPRFTGSWAGAKPANAWFTRPSPRKGLRGREAPSAAESRAYWPRF